MQITHIAGYTRVIGEQQGYIGLPLRDIVTNDSVTGPETPAMESAWQPDAADIVALQAGGQVILRVVGQQHPPVAIYVDVATDDQAALHNRLAGEIVKSIIKPVISGGGSLTDVMVPTESVLLGVCLACVRLGGDEKALDIMVGHVRARLAEIRLGDIEAQGTA
jgi:hypothetical protein